MQLSRAREAGVAIGGPDESRVLQAALKPVYCQQSGAIRS